jgi:predicted nucleic acid-binding protein
MQRALFDTSIYMSALRRGNDASLVLGRLAADAPLWLSSVVLEELYAGAGDRERRAVERLERDFDRGKKNPGAQSQ